MKSKARVSRSTINLNGLDSDTFEHLVNCLASETLGKGLLSFSKGADAGRDGYLEGECDYPTTTDRWKGRWYIQSKYCSTPRPSASWLLVQLKSEIEAFSKPDSRRQWPDNWIIATNVSVSAGASGLFEKVRQLIAKKNKKLAARTHIWGEQKLSSLLVANPHIAKNFGHLLTPGFLIDRMLKLLDDQDHVVESIINHLTYKSLLDQQYTKLDQAGSSNDTRPGIHELYIDLPYSHKGSSGSATILRTLSKSSALRHIATNRSEDSKEWRSVAKTIDTSRVYFIKGGPGQGKTTVGQYFSQIHRASLVLRSSKKATRLAEAKHLASRIKKKAEEVSLWPLVPRLPIVIDLKEYVRWINEQSEFASKGVITYLASLWSAACQINCGPTTVRKILKNNRCFVAFDGLDEVPTEFKDGIASEAKRLIEDDWSDLDLDLLVICTSRPQGYSGQFDQLEAAQIELSLLSKELAFKCAAPLLKIDRNRQEIAIAEGTLRDALNTEAVEQLMRTPLQCHIMAIVVRDGGRPPERRWQLFSNFYDVIRKREARNKIADKELLRLLQEETALLKRLHNSVGFLLHTRAEAAKGSVTSVNRSDFNRLCGAIVESTVEKNSERTVSVLMAAATDRLVLVNTPDNGDKMRFDVRQLQEFFSGEYVYEGITADEFRKRFEIIAADAHWREVVYFIVSAMVENRRQTELSIAIQALQRINSGTEDFEHCPNLAGAMAVGMLVALRLLQEGVLEQDKSARAQFQDVLKPIIWSFDPSALRLAVSVRGLNSRAWLGAFLLHEFDKTEPSIRIGSAIVLIHLAEGDSELQGEVKKRLFAKDFTTLKMVLSLSPQSLFLLVHERPPLWFKLELTRMISSEAWRDDINFTKSILTAIQVMHFRGHHYPKSDSDVLSPADLLLAELWDGGINIRRKKIGDSLIEIAYRGVRGFARSPIRGSEDLGGLLGVWNAIIAAASDGDEARLAKAVSSIPSVDHMDIVLSSLKIKQCLVVDGDLDEDGSFAQAVFERFVARKKTISFKSKDFLERSVELRKGIDLDTFRASVRINPIPAVLEVLFDFPRRSAPSELTVSQRSILREIGDIFISSPKISFMFHSAWGVVFSVRNESERLALADAICSVDSPSVSLDSHFWVPHYIGFPVEIPRHMRLLPFLLSSLLLSEDYGVRRIGSDGDTVIGDDCSNHSEQLKAAIKYYDKLPLVYGGETESLPIRASALLADISIKRVKIRLSSEDINLLVDAVKADHSGLFSRLFARWIMLRGRQLLANGNLLVERALVGVEAKPRQRENLEIIFQRWREASISPVSRVVGKVDFRDIPPELLKTSAL